MNNFVTKLSTEKRDALLKELEKLMNNYGIDGICNVPDFILADALLDTIYSVEKLRCRVNWWMHNESEEENKIYNGKVDVFYTPKGDTDKLATEVSIRGTKIYPPKGMLIGKVTPKDNSFFVEFVESDKSIEEWSMKKEVLTETDKKAIVDANVKMSLAGMYPPEINIGNIYNIRFEVKQIYADRPAEYTMIEVPMDDGLARNLPSTDDFPNDNREKFFYFAEKYLKAKGWIPNDDNITLTRYEIVDVTPKGEVTYMEKEVVDGGTVTHNPLNMERYGLKEGDSLDGLYTHFNIDEDDMDIGTFIEYLTEKQKQKYSERRERIIRQLKMTKNICDSETMKCDNEINK